MKDYYKILGVSNSASQEDIKKSYHRLAHQYHPDKNGGDDVKFKEINEAYQVLGDKNKRTQYNQFGSAFDFNQQGASSGFGGFDGFSDFFRGQGGQRVKINFEDLGGFGDVFSDMFGFNSRAKRARKGKNIQVDITIDLKDAFSGLQKEISLNKMVVCGNCAGKGAEPNSSFAKCPECNGDGQIRRASQTILGSFSQVVVCAKCDGEGTTPKSLCKKCGGDGRVREIARVEMDIPRGIEDGQAIKVSGQGEAAVKSNISGDLYVVVHIKPHPYFKRKGADIHCREVINFTQAVLGDKIDIHTLDGPVLLKVPAGIQSGKVLKLRGRGMKLIHGSGCGDQYVEVLVKTPNKLSRKAKKIIEELKEEGI